MAKTTIEWTIRWRPDGTAMPGYTFNPWWGCWRISPACKDCYADAWAARTGHPDLWSPHGPRRFFGDAHWNEPLKWQRLAAELGERHAVFCASMADVGEDRRDLDPWRERLWRLIGATPNLLWLLVTKRPAELRKLAPWRAGAWPRNVWFGVTVETQAYLGRVEEALRAMADLTFISYEPALEPVDFRSVLGRDRSRAQWLIVGTESGGSRARRLELAWAESAVAQARAAGAAPFVKQLDAELLQIGRRGEPVKNLSHFPEPLRVREWPLILEAA